MAMLQGDASKSTPSSGDKPELRPLVELGVPVDSPTTPQDDVVTDSSPVQDAPQQDEQQAEPAPDASATPEPEPFHKHPRFQEILRERDEARRQTELAMQTMQRLAPQPVQAQPADPWAPLLQHPDPATAQFYAQQKALLFDPLQQQLSMMQQQVELGRREFASVKIAQFRKENPEIQPGSQEEQVMASYVQQGLDLENAKKLALYDKLDAENRALKGKSQQRSQAAPIKRAANVESGSGMPETAGLPQHKETWLQSISRKMDEQGGDVRKVLGINR